MREYFQRILDDAEIDVPVGECWLLVQLRKGCGDTTDLAQRSGATDDVIHAALTNLEARHLVTISADETPAIALTDSGVTLADLVLARTRERLDKLLDGWTPDRYPELARTLDEFAVEIIPATQPGKTLVA
jgi:DNA-binding MarR family transcriptional regulator